jgi:hypothetical protein
MSLKLFPTCFSFTRNNGSKFWKSRIETFFELVLQQKSLCITSFNNLRNALLMRNVNWEMQQWQRIKSKTSTSLSKAFASKAASRNLSIDNN